MRAKRFLAGALPLLLCVLFVDGRETAAQERAPRSAAVGQNTVVVSTQETPVQQTYVRSQGDADKTFVFVSTEMAIDGKVVKGAPYSAEAVTETTQMLADGNRIVRKNSSQIYRDGEGRTRREQSIGMIGPYVASGDPAQTVFIHDPVSGASYILDPKARTARKVLTRFSFEREMKRETEVKAQAMAAQSQGEGKGEGKLREKSRGYTFHAPGAGVGGPDVMYFGHEGHEPKVEELGTDVVEGVKAEGRRITVTIPAGEVGNERDINIVTERWYSPELQTVVRTSHTDPRFGTTVYRLSNINRTEPASTLFQVPGDYALKEGPTVFSGGRTMRMKRPEGGKENFVFEFNGRPEEN
jgi:hypothetical protein